MLFDKFDKDEVFSHYAALMENNLEKKASYEFPVNMLDENYSEIDISDVINKIAENEAKKLYDISSEDVLKSAHPEGSTKIVDAQDGLGVVETQEEAQKKDMQVAQKKAAIAEKVIKLTAELDKGGFTSLAYDLDAALAKFLGLPLPKKVAQDFLTEDPSVKVEQDPAQMQADAALVQLSQDLANAFTSHNPYTKGIQNALMLRVEDGSDMALKEFMRDIREKYWRYLPRDVAENLRKLHDEAGEILKMRQNVGSGQAGVSKPGEQ